MRAVSCKVELGHVGAALALTSPCAGDACVSLPLYQVCRNIISTIYTLNLSHTKLQVDNPAEKHHISRKANDISYYNLVCFKIVIATYYNYVPTSFVLLQYYKNIKFQ